MSVWNRIDATLLYPPFRTAVQLLLEEAAALDVSFWPIAGFRSYLEQNNLYNLGRIDKGPIVTNARPGQSAHNFGLAVDLCRDRDVSREGLQPDWHPPAYEPLRALTAKHGLAWGGSWAFKDLPHVQWPGFVTAKQLAPLRDIFELKGLTAVWDYLDDLAEAP